MAKQLKLRRGTTSQHSSFTGAEGEVTVDTDKETLVVHDGSTAGGHPVAAEDMANVSSASIAGRLANDSIAPSKIGAGGLPSDVTIGSANIVDGTIVNADINASADIANSKLADSGVTAGSVGSSTAIPIITVNAKGIITGTNTTSIDSTRIDNGTSNVRVNNNNSTNISFAGTDRLTVGNAGVDITGTLDATGDVGVGGNLTVQNADPYIDIVDSDHNSDFRLSASGGNFVVRDTTNGANRITLASNGTVDIAGNLDANGGIDVTGDIAATGNFSAVDITGSGDLSAKDITISDTTPTLLFTDTDANPDYSIRVNGGLFQISDATNGNANRIVVNTDGHVDITGNLDAEGGVDVTGNITVTGTVDGVDVAALNTTVSNLGVSGGAIASSTTATTQSQGDNSTKIATTAYTDTAVSNLVDSSPSALNTLNELAAAIGDDANFSTTVTNNIATKMPLAGGEFTGNITVENITPDGDSSRNIGTDSTRFANGYFDTLYGDGSNLTGIQGIPSGVIMIWSGAQNAIPSGFVLCNGSNSTPDLRDRFVVGSGAGASYSVGDTGGANSVTLSTSQMPAHSHSMTVTDPGHYHTTNDYVARAYYQEPRNIGSATDGNCNYTGDTNTKTTGISVSAGNTGGGSSHENRPPYYALCYIMKT